MAFMLSFSWVDKFFCCNSQNHTYASIGFAIILSCCLNSQPALAEISVFAKGQDYVIWDSNQANNCLLSGAASSSKSSKSDCLNSIGVSGLPVFSDTTDSNFTNSSNTLGLTLILVLWTEIVPFVFFCLVLAAFVSLLPSP